MIDNYDNLPKMSYFIKGNMFSKDENYYNSRKICQMLDSEELSGWDKQLLVGNYSHTNTTPLRGSSRLVDSRQPISWCSFGGNPSKWYFNDHTSLIQNLFENPPSTDIIEFVPGSIFLFTKENILKYSKNLYQN